QDKVVAFVMDNATNNDTLIQAIENRCIEDGIAFDASRARLRCMPHTIHLAAIKLLEGIGAISASDGRKATTRIGNYQDCVIAPLDQAQDD
ncbi:hypothetical protein BD779DRAFT_1407483, partial [Infundibulicybe gibba]